MSKTIFVVCVVLSISKGDIDSVNKIDSTNNMAVHTNDYIKLNQKQYAKILQDYDSRLADFRERHIESANEINVEMLTASIVRLEEFVNPLQVSGDLGKQCVNKYLSIYPTKNNTSTALNHCVMTANHKLTNLWDTLLSTRNSLENGYSKNFKRELINCGQVYNKTMKTYTYCITAVTFNVNSHNNINQKIFNSQMEDAECTAKATIKKAVDCAYAIQTRANFFVVEANRLINKCLEGSDECKPCKKDFICPDVYNLQVDYEVETIPNPFYRQNNTAGCLMLNIVRS